MAIAAVPATDLQHGWADEADEVADGRQRRPQHAAPRPRHDMPRRSGEHQARPAGLSGVPRGGEGRGQRGGLVGWGQPSHRSVVFRASPLVGESSLPGVRPRLGGCPSGVTRQSRSPPDPGSNFSVRPCSVTVRTTCSDAPPGSRASISIDTASSAPTSGLARALRSLESPLLLGRRGNSVLECR